MKIFWNWIFQEVIQFNCSPPFLAVNGNRSQSNKKATPAKDYSLAGVFIQMVVIESQDLKNSG
jgi:hypothetical protein